MILLGGRERLDSLQRHLLGAFAWFYEIPTGTAHFQHPGGLTWTISCDDKLGGPLPGSTYVAASCSRFQPILSPIGHWRDLYNSVSLECVITLASCVGSDVYSKGCCETLANFVVPDSIAHGFSAN